MSEFPFDLGSKEKPLALADLEKLVADLVNDDLVDRQFAVALAIVLGRIMPLIDRRSYWGGLCKVHDQLPDRYNFVSTHAIGYNATCKLVDYYNLESSAGYTAWLMRFDRDSGNPDRFNDDIGTLVLTIPSNNGAWELISLFTRLYELSQVPTTTH